MQIVDRNKSRSTAADRPSSGKIMRVAHKIQGRRYDDAATSRIYSCPNCNKKPNPDNLGGIS